MVVLQAFIKTHAKLNGSFLNLCSHFCVQMNQIRFVQGYPKVSHCWYYVLRIRPRGFDRLLMSDCVLVKGLPIVSFHRIPFLPASVLYA